MNDVADLPPDILLRVVTVRVGCSDGRECLGARECMSAARTPKYYIGADHARAPDSAVVASFRKTRRMGLLGTGHTVILDDLEPQPAGPPIELRPRGLAALGLGLAEQPFDPTKLELVQAHGGPRFTVLPTPSLRAFLARATDMSTDIEFRPWKRATA